jgi:hypothetical protein
VTLVDPVADGPGLHGSTDHVIQIDLASDLLVNEQAELVGDTVHAVAIALNAARRES